MEEKLSDKFGYTELETKTALYFLINNLKIIKDYTRLPETICRDSDDDNILAAAISIKADCILTGNKDLLVLKNYKNINIITPKGFWILEKVFIKKN